ncbi:MAG: HIT domain-containing protein [Planctomycetaceae bacterium]|nr:HIT domain-containing protein [Planctomycetaceae bacterium]
METIWAPWRLAYVAGDSDEKKPNNSKTDCKEESTQDHQEEKECFLCKYLKEETSQDRKNLLFLRGEQAMVVFNRYPYNNGHMLITPREHLSDLLEIPADVQAECQQLLAQMVTLLRETIQPDGFNIGLNLGSVAGSGLPGHLHWHIVPRWEGDTNFMPVVGNTKVIPQSMEALYDLLSEKLDSADQSQSDSTISNGA